MKLYVEDNEAIPAIQVLADSDPAPEGFTEKVTIADWDTNGLKDISKKELRDVYINQFLSGWGTMSDTEKKSLIRVFVWDSSATDTELDELYTPSEREELEEDVIRAHRKYGCAITMSTTPGSKKRINLTSDDSETPSAIIIKAHLSIQ